jgi:hypothetical protein
MSAPYGPLQGPPQGVPPGSAGASGGWTPQSPPREPFGLGKILALVVVAAFLALGSFLPGAGGHSFATAAVSLGGAVTLLFGLFDATGLYGEASSVGAGFIVTLIGGFLQAFVALAAYLVNAGVLKMSPKPPPGYPGYGYPPPGYSAPGYPQPGTASYPQPGTPGYPQPSSAPGFPPPSASTGYSTGAQPAVPGSPPNPYQ